MKWYGKYRRKLWNDMDSWIVKRYEKYGRNPSWIVIRYGDYGRKVSWIVKRFGQYGRKASWMVKRYEIMEETWVE